MNHMDHGMDMDMDMDMSMGNSSMDGAMNGPPSCKMSMYWNWYTVDACFMSESWHITSQGMFAGSCIGIVLLVMSMELLRRCQREYDRLIVRQWNQKIKDQQLSQSNSDRTIDQNNSKPGFQVFTKAIGLVGSQSASDVFKPTAFQQFVRSLMYALQMGVAYIIMLLVMYYNGYIYFCILIGGLLGFFFFGSDNISSGVPSEDGVSTPCC